MFTNASNNWYVFACISSVIYNPQQVVEKKKEGMISYIYWNFNSKRPSKLMTIAQYSKQTKVWTLLHKQ